MQNLETRLEMAERELERRAKLLEEVIMVANVLNRTYLGQMVDWTSLGLDEVKEFEKDTDLIKWPKQEFPVDCRHKYKGEKGDCNGSCGGGGRGFA